MSHSAFGKKICEASKPFGESSQQTKVCAMESGGMSMMSSADLLESRLRFDQEALRNEAVDWLGDRSCVTTMSLRLYPGDHLHACTDVNAGPRSPRFAKKRSGK